jgi:iron complex transport system permease protein
LPRLRLLPAAEKRPRRDLFFVAADPHRSSQRSRTARLKARPGDAPLIAAMALVVAALFLASLAVGPVVLPLPTVAAALFGQADRAGELIVTAIRLPRAILGVAIGGSLGLAGASLQGLLRNPLAAPELFGAPSAAGLAAVLAISAGLADTLSFALPLAGLVGAFASVALLVLIAGPRASLLVLILAGLAVASLAAAGTSLILDLAPNPFASLEITFWLLGSLQDRSMQHVLIAAPFMVVGAGLLLWDRRALRALALGEDAATSLGFDLPHVRLRVVVGVAVAVGAAVAVAGTIGFIGLVAPHLMRPFVRHDPGRLLIPAALSGAALLSAADIAVRLIPSQAEIGVGVVTALIGAPFFIVLIMRRRGDLAGAPG